MTLKTIQLSDLKRSLAKELRIYLSDNEADAHVKIILEHFDISTNMQLLQPEFAVNCEIQAEIKKIVAEIKQNRPIQYILGYTWFYDRKFIVNEHVLIPRPETEELVDAIIKDRQAKPTQILDIGTGSGCIAISLAKNLAHSKVYALDISSEAIEVASENSQNSEAHVSFIQENILLNPELNAERLFDVIVSNPPYVMEKEKALMLPGVLDFEPELALFVTDKDPLIFYRAIAEFAKTKLESNGTVWLEINEQLGQDTAAIFQEAGFANTEIRKDLQGKNRMIKAWRHD